MPTERRSHAENHAVNSSVSQFTWGCQEFAPACLCPCYKHISTPKDTITALGLVGSCIFYIAPFENPLAKISFNVRGFFYTRKKNDIPLEFVTCSELFLGNVLVEFYLKCSFDEPTAYCMLLWSLGKLVANYCINFGPLLLVFVVLRRRYKVMEYLSTASALTLRCIDPYRNNPQLTSASKSVQKINCMPCNFRYLRRDVAN